MARRRRGRPARPGLGPARPHADDARDRLPDRGVPRDRLVRGRPRRRDGRRLLAGHAPKGAGLLRVPSTKSGEKGERLVPLPSWAVEMLRHRRTLVGPGVEPVFPDSFDGWRDPSNVRRVWRDVREKAQMAGVVSHTLRKNVASFLDDANVSARKISDQLGHAKVSMTQDRYLGRRLTDGQTADVLEAVWEVPREERSPKRVPGKH